MLKKLFFAVALIVAVGTDAFGVSKYKYTTVEGDPMHSLLYTLPNGLKVYMTVNKEQPRIQTYIAVKVGGKNDPAETTGLAHYFEHMMFKGTKQFGTSDYPAEEKLLNQIEQLFETYRRTTDEAARTALYHQIDSISYEASKLAIPNEYDKLMAAIGANGTNAYTSYDVTCYTEDIPSNQIENWARIQADRFANPVLRGFHTELETIYEEKNMDMTSDGSKVYDELLAALFPNHPYGKQSILGTQTHLKNPSITNIKNYHSQWYVPNNMAIALSGDFDPDEMIDIISRHFGQLKPNPQLPVLSYRPEEPITSPVVREVVGNESESIYMGWRFPGAASREAEVLQILNSILSNGNAGLIDLDINHQQKALYAGSGLYDMADYTAFLLIGAPKEGQTLDDVRGLLLGEIAKLRSGDFDETLIEATINNYKRNQQKLLESNAGRADRFVNSFVNGSEWGDEVTALDRQSKLTKADIVDFANRYLGDNNYVAIYKRQGKDTTALKIAKPQITPIVMNRDMSSDFLKSVQNSQVEPIEPVFVDFTRDIDLVSAKDGRLPVIYKKNDTNGLSSVIYVFDMGTRHNPLLSPAAEYIDLLGTSDMSAEQFKNELYRLGCEYTFTPGLNRSYIRINGLSENMPAAMALVDRLITGVQPDKEAYDALVDRIVTSRTNAKANQRRNFNALRDYMIYGDAMAKTQLTNDQLRALDPKLLAETITTLFSYPHRVIYYGPESRENALSLIDSTHSVADSFLPIPESMPLDKAVTGETIIFLAPYDAKQLNMAMYSNRGNQFDAGEEPLREMYNEYFGGGMNSIVFQELRESRSLAYSAGAYMQKPAYADQPYTYITFISTQNDKLMDAVGAFNEIINDMPRSQAAFDLAKDALDARLRTERVIGENVAWNYINAVDLGLDQDSRKTLYDRLGTFTLDDVAGYQNGEVKDRVFYYAVLADPGDIDIEALQKIGKVVRLTTDEIFGY